MKFFKPEDDNIYLTKKQWRKVFYIVSFSTIFIYIVGMIFSLCGSDYFIVRYQNAQMDKIEGWLTERNIMPLLNCVFLTLEFAICLCFVLNKRTKLWYILTFYGVRTILSIPFAFPAIVDYIYPFAFYFIFSIIDQLIFTKKVSGKAFLKQLYRILMVILITLLLQVMLYVIKTGSFSMTNHIMNLSGTFIYAIEYDIALSILLYTVALFLNREKGDNVCTTFQPHGGFSQTSKKQLLKSSLTKTQKTKIRLLYARLYLTQILGFLALMILPFLLGKVLEFLLMYTVFAIVRYALGFQYSLHYKKETICIAVGVAVFGVLSLVVPFFYAVIIAAVLIGAGLAIFLHLSYKYKSFVLFARVNKPDKFALLYVFFDGDLTERHVKVMCHYKGLDRDQTNYIWGYVAGEKVSYLAKKYNYSHRMFIYKLDEAIDKLVH